MASLLDQYKEGSENEEPIFWRHQIDVSLQDRVTHAAVANDYIVVAMAKSNTLVWFNRRKGSQWVKFKELELSRVVPGVNLTEIFLDPSANHLLISFSTELLYQHRKSSKAKPGVKLKGHEVTAVGWSSSSGTPTNTGPMLLGTSRGIIFEMEISSEETIFASSHELYLKQVFDIGKGTPLKITGLEYERVGDSDVYYVIATTQNRLYEFTGTAAYSKERPLLQQLFNKYLSLPEGFQVILSDLPYSKLAIHKPRKSLPALAWLTQTGVFLAQIETRTKGNLLSKTRMLAIDFPPPLEMVLTDFHILLLHDFQVVGISTLNQNQVFQELYHDTLVRIIKDPVSQTIWVFGERGIYNYSVHREDRHVWKIYVEKGDYETAKLFCKDDPASMDEVLIKQADALFKNKQYKESALCYAESQSSFEKVALQFLRADQHHALKAFLSKKLDKLVEEGSSDKAEFTMLVVWILELLLTRLGEEEHNTSQRTLLQAELDQFLLRPQVRKCVERNRVTVYNLMGSHGDEENLLKLAKATGDIAKVISHHLHKGQYDQALTELVRQRENELWYKFAGPLVENLPKQFINAAMDHKPTLSPTKLLPSLIATSDNIAVELMRYLEFCILNCRETAVHNMLLLLYARHNEKKLMSYLAMQGQEASMVNYDIGFGVRVCREYKRTEGCVELCALLGLWESAVGQALTIEVALAKQTASLSSCPPHLARKLWLQIAEHVVKKENDIASAMEFLKECEQIKIEDILPFFSNFESIDHFKDAICSSLQEYNQHIQEVKEEMEDATKSAETIRSEIFSFRKRYTEIKEMEKCECCNLGLMLRPFYAFPCSHRFHSDCLAEQINTFLNERECQILSDLQKNASSGNELARARLDSVLASQCLHCGDRAIELISKGFFEDEDYEKMKKEWE